MGLRGGEDDCMEQLRKSLLEEGREGLVKRVEGEEEGEKRCKEGGGRRIYMHSNNNPLGVWYAMAC